MEISVVVPCLNEEKYIKTCLESIVNNGFLVSEMEILVVDGGSADSTLDIIAEIQKSISSVKLLSNPKRKTPFALNIGVQNSTGKYVLVAGAHATYPPDYINNLYKQIQKPEIDVIGGAIETCTKTINTKTNAIKYVLSHRFGVGNSKFRTGASQMSEVDTVPFGLYNREVFNSAGLYNEKLIRNHDIELSKRILSKGFKIWLMPEFKVKYYARETFTGLAKNNYGNGYWNLKTLYITRKMQSLSLRHYIPLIFVLSVIGPLLLGLLFYSKLILVSALSLLLYVLTIGFFSFRNHKKLNPLIVFWVFVTLHFSYGFGSLLGAVSFYQPK